MIRFSLLCDSGHGFEAWFGGNDDFDDQARRGLVECPVCASTAVAKALMAPALAPGVKGRGENGEGASAAPPAAPPDPHAVAREAMRRLAARVRETTVDVGNRFPEEARRIHYGEAEERGIRGRATPSEARALVEEGIGIAPVPVAPDEAN